MAKKRRGRSRIGILLAVCSLVATLLAATPLAALEEGTDGADEGANQQPVTQSVEVFGPFTPTLSTATVNDLTPSAAWRPGDPVTEQPRHNFRGEIDSPAAATNPTTWSVDPLLDVQAAASRDPERALAAPDLNFAGQTYTGVNPPDTVGDVGSTHYVQMVNGAGGSEIAVYNKSDGAAQVVGFELDGLWPNPGEPCATGSGDPIVLYDHLADRWLLTEFADVGNHLCVYVSVTGDVLNSSWNTYDFATPNFPDYPKYAVWPDAYYVSTNEGSPAAYAMDRTALLAGNPATMQRFSTAPLAAFGFQGLTPGDLDGPAPPAGTPGYFVRHRDDEAHNPGSNDPTNDFLDLWEFSVDWTTPANSTFTALAPIPITEIDSELCGFLAFECFQQPSGQQLDPLREVVMWRFVYRNFGAHETLLGNLVTDVDNTDHGGVRWFELRKTGSAPWALFQEGTYAPDGDSRWMGSIAMDQNGNMALGYNVTSPTQLPDLRYVGRLATDSPGTMPNGEHTLVAASGSNGSNRWGDYASMNVDPVDDCTFWFTGETAVASSEWATQIGSFSFDGCAPDATAPTVTITTPSDGGTYTTGATVPADYSCVDETGGSGVASCTGDVASGSPIDTATAGPGTFTVTGTDNAGNTKTVVHTYTINAPPVASDVSISGAPNTTIGWTPAVSDPDGDPLSCSVTKQPAHGTATVVANCSSGTYKSDAGFDGKDSFTYEVSDGAGTDTALVSVTILKPGGTFVDDDGNVHEGNIEAIAAVGITKGCNPPTNDKYCPDAFVTRGQMAAFLVRAFGLTDDGGGNLFIDDDTSIFEADIDKLATAGITKGCNPPANNKYCPKALVTRGQMAAFLVRALGLTDDGGGNLFIDDDTSIFEADIDKLATAGITKGCNPPANDKYCPDAFVKRSQMASFLARALGLDPIIPPPR